MLNIILAGALTLILKIFPGLFLTKKDINPEHPFLNYLEWCIWMVMGGIIYLACNDPAEISHSFIYDPVKTGMLIIILLVGKYFKNNLALFLASFFAYLLYLM